MRLQWRSKERWRKRCWVILGALSSRSSLKFYELWSYQTNKLKNKCGMLVIAEMQMKPFGAHGIRIQKHNTIFGKRNFKKVWFHRGPEEENEIERKWQSEAQRSERDRTEGEYISCFTFFLWIPFFTPYKWSMCTFASSTAVSVKCYLMVLLNSKHQHQINVSQFKNDNVINDIFGLKYCCIAICSLLGL